MTSFKVGGVIWTFPIIYGRNINLFLKKIARPLLVYARLST